MNRSGWFAVGVGCMLMWTGCKKPKEHVPPPPPPPTVQKTKVAPILTPRFKPLPRRTQKKAGSSSTKESSILDQPLPSVDLKSSTLGINDDSKLGMGGSLGGGLMGGDLGLKSFSAKNSKETLGVGSLRLGSTSGLKKDLGALKLDDTKLSGDSLKLKDAFGTTTRADKDRLLGDEPPVSQPTSKPTQPNVQVPAKKAPPIKQVKPAQPTHKRLKPPSHRKIRTVPPTSATKQKPSWRSILQVPTARSSSILANVNNEPVYKSDFLWALLLHKRVWESQNGSLLREHLPMFRKKVLERVIDEYIVYQRAIQKGVQLTARDRQRGMQMFQARIRGMNLGNLMRRARISPQQFRQILNRQLYLEKYKLELAKGVKISLETAKAYYKKTTGVARVHARQMLFATPDKATHEQVVALRERASQIAEIIRKSGGRMGLVAKRLSDPKWGMTYTDLGVVSTGDSIPSIEKVLFSLPKNQVSQPIRTEAGFHLLQVYARRAPRPFVLMQTKIVQMLYQRKLMELLQKEASELRREAQIEILVPWGK